MPIKSFDYFRQPVLFDGLNVGNLSFTDIDGVMDYRGKGLLILELKYQGAPVPHGQELALERIAKSYAEWSGGVGLVLIADHDVDPPEEPVEAAEAKVRKYYWAIGGRTIVPWRSPRQELTVVQAKDIFIRKVDKLFSMKASPP